MFIDIALKTLFGIYHYKINKQFVKTLLVTVSKSGQRLRNQQNLLAFLQENISEKDKRTTRITRRTDQQSIDIYYDTFIRVLLNTNVIIRGGKNNVIDIISYFGEYLEYKNQYYTIIRKIFIIGVVFFVSPVLNLLFMSHVVLNVIDIPGTVNQIAETPISMPLFEFTYENMIPIVVILLCSISGLVYFKIALDKFKKIWGYDILEGYIINLFSYVLIQGYYKNGRLIYFDYYEILVRIVNDLYIDSMIPEENYVNYINYLEYKKNEQDKIGKKVLPNEIIEDNLDVYAQMTVKGETIGFHKIFDEVSYNFNTFRTSYVDNLKVKIDLGNEIFKGMLGVWWIGTTVSILAITAYISLATSNL